MSAPESEFPQKAGRAEQTGASLAIAKIAGNLALASSITIALLVGIVFSLVTATIFIVNSPNPILGFGVAVIVTVLVNAIIFFVSPWIMDLTQGWLYHTRWVKIEEIERLRKKRGRRKPHVLIGAEVENLLLREFRAADAVLQDGAKCRYSAIVQDVRPAMLRVDQHDLRISSGAVGSAVEG